jgi:endonuclease YncB( thermonuclease family)
VNIFGEKSLSELLLEKGLAVSKPGFNDKIYKFYFDKAEEKAKSERIALWDEGVSKECRAYIHVE